jgi:phosphatidylinositol alpha-mannosyltransferase
MRIALVCPYSLTFPGGVQNQVLALARALRNRGHTTYVLGPCDGPPPDVNVIPLGNSVPTAGNGSIAPLAPDFSAAARTVRVLRNERFDVVHLHEPLCPGPALTALLFADTPSVGTFHRKGQLHNHRFLAPIMKTWAARLEIRVAVSEESRQSAEAMYEGKYQTLFNGIEIERFAKAPIEKPSVPTVLFLGRHEHRKGLSVLLDAFDQLPTDTQLWIAGIGPETEALKARTKDNERIHWLGRIHDNEAASRMASADVFCAPSLSGESFGIVLLEAMAAGTLVVASDLAGYRSVATHEKNALLTPPGDSQAVAEAISRVLSNSALAQTLVDNARERAEEFSMSKLAEHYEDLYEQARLLAR